ncbi:MAG: glycosyltransferase family 87 protein [Propionibacterium sp.]|nr:glycosyltransferase family 87 protein [Propionibacterium sp.]
MANSPFRPGTAIGRLGRLEWVPRGDPHGVRAIFGALGHTTSTRFVWVSWVVSRALIFVFWGSLNFSLGDTRYYFIKMSLLAQTGPGQTMIEYPTPVLWFFDVLYGLSFHHQYVFSGLFVATMVILDAGFTWMLWRVGARRRGEAVFFWTVFLLLVGPTAYLRFDLVTAVLGGLALLALERRDDLRAGLLTGVGAAIKLWPALLWPALLGGDRRSRIRTSVGFFGAGGILAVLALWYAGWTRLLSPLQYQSARGLQIESLWAVPPMLWRIFHLSSYAVNVSIWNAWEISGPMTETMLVAAKLAQAIGLVFVAVCYIAWLRRGRQRFVEASALMQLVILVMILTNKTFSPQYMMWLGGPAAAGIAMLPHSGLADDTDQERVRSDHEAVDRLRTITRVFLVCTLLTTIVYPVGYSPIVHGTIGLSVVTIVLATRNLMLSYLLYLVALWVVHFSRLTQLLRFRGSHPHSPRTVP